MQIIDITYPDLENFYNSLVEKLSTELTPDDSISVVGIANSGLHLSKPIHQRIAQNGHSSAKTMAVRCQRPHSKARDSSSSVLRWIPKVVANVLRTLEHHLLQRIRPIERTVDLNGQEETISRSSYILIVDDAVDSGHSMKSVFEKIKQLAPDAKIQLVAFVITQKNPVITPEFYQHKNVIVRFPWAVDSKQS